MWDCDRLTTPFTTSPVSLARPGLFCAFANSCHSSIRLCFFFPRRTFGNGLIDALRRSLRRALRSRMQGGSLCFQTNERRHAAKELAMKKFLLVKSLALVAFMAFSEGTCRADDLLHLRTSILKQINAYRQQ